MSASAYLASLDWLSEEGMPRRGLLLVLLFSNYKMGEGGGGGSFEGVSFSTVM